MRQLKGGMHRLESVALGLDDRIHRFRHWVKRALFEEDGDTGEVIKVGAAVVLIALLVVFGKQVMEFIKTTWEEITG